LAIALPGNARWIPGSLRGGESMQRNPHRTLRVYAASLDLIERALRATSRVPLRSRHVEDQLLRASTSIAVNIAEGASEWAAGDKARFYRIARRSAAEAGAAFDVLARHGVVTRNEADHANSEIETICAMLTSMIHAAERRRALSRSNSVQSVPREPAPGTSPVPAVSVPREPSPRNGP
jgi:four helix bundle protein